MSRSIHTVVSQLVSTCVAICLGICFTALAEEVPQIKLSASLALSGKLAFIGEEERRGLELAAKEINHNHSFYGVGIELVVEDNQGDAKTAVTGMNALLNRDRPTVVFSAFTHITKALAPILERFGVVLVYAAVVKDIARSNRLFFRDYIDAEEAGRKMALAITRSGKQHLTVLTQTRDFCGSYLGSVESGLAGSPARIQSTQNYSPDETDFRPMLLRMRQQRPDAIILCALGGTGLFMRQLSESGMLAVPTFLWLAPHLPDDDTAAMRELYEKNRALTSWHDFILSDLTPVQRHFVDLYRQHYGADPGPDAAYGYDDAMLLAQAGKHCKSSGISAECIARQLSQASMSGAAGEISFDAERSARRRVLIARVSNGEWVKADSRRVE